MEYTITKHHHNFAIWTSARAVQRGFTDTSNIGTAVDAANLKELIDCKTNFTDEQFDAFHREKANIIINCLKRIDNKLEDKVTYGRAAKIIAIYIKTISVIRDSGKSNLAKIAHPPIDRILLTNAHIDNNKLGLDKYNWTQLTEDKYFELISKLRTLEYNYFWEIERYWSPK
jgi:hypothetical protein